jgi:4-aminobutyrate aminotransferase-like enzyme
VETCELECLKYLRQDFEYMIPAEDVSAVIFEIVQGEGGYIVPPRKYTDALVELCREIGALLIVDEIQTGMGRTGKMFASEHFGVTPDILCLGKAVGGGFPMSVVASTHEIMEGWAPGSHGTTFGGHPVAAAAGLAQLKILTKPGFLDSVTAKGNFFRSGLKKLQERFSAIGEVRGLGFMNAVEFVKETGAPDSETANNVRKYLLAQKILVLTCGVNGQAVRFIPPLNIDESLLDLVLQELAQALDNL